PPPSGSSSCAPRILDSRPQDVAAGGAGPGTYQIKVGAATADTGGFEIGVSDRPVEAAQPIPFSTYVAGNLERLADENVYTLQGRQGDVVTVNVTGTGFAP